MGEETKTSEEVVKPDSTLFRGMQRDIGKTAVNGELFKEVINEDIRKSISNDGRIDISLFKTVDEYREIIGEPYSVKFYEAKEIYNRMTEDDFENIDRYILNEIKKAHQKSTLEVYTKTLKNLERILNLSDDYETMHRIVTVSKFIQHGNQ